MVDASELDGFPLAVIEVNADLTVSGWNGRAQQIFGTGAAEAVGRGIAEVLPVAGGSEGWRSGLVAPDPAPRLWAVRREAGELMFEAWTQVRRDDAGAPVGFTLYGHDATARVAAGRRAALESTMLAAIKENLDIAVWAIDAKANFLYQDGKGVRTSGMQPHQLVGLNILDLYKGTGGDVPIKRALAGESTRQIAVEVHDRYWDSWYIPMPPGDSHAAVVGVTLDVTEASRRELELKAKLELIERQQEVIRELATPIIEVWDGVLTMPIVGLVDTARAADVMDNLLQSVTRTRARFAILDLTGVEVVDTGTASHLINMIQAIRLLGAEGILTGIHPMIAQTIVALGVDLSQVRVFAKLRDALGHCIQSRR